MAKIKFFSIFIALCFFVGNITGQSVLGVWKTIDDKTKEPKSHVKLYEKNGKLYGKVVKLLPAATTKVCIDCPGDKKGKSLFDIDIVWDMKKQGSVYDDGEIVDPANGKVYSCKMYLKDKNTLTVRGYLGISLLGRSQTWYRVE
ncbi:MAG: DUF2147 domain-containing protein [Deltaproteobacteria bacterium]